MSSTNLQALASVSSLRNLTVSWKQLLCHHMKTSSWEIKISILTVKTAGLILSTLCYQILILSNVSTPTHIHGHILHVLCNSKSLTFSVCHYVKDGISDHLAVFFTTTFPVRKHSSCRIKHSKVRKLGKINKCKFTSNIADSELIQAPYKQLLYYHTNIFIHLGTYLTSIHLYMNAKIHNMSIKWS